ncbi:MAG: aminopeptidase N, partial [Beijerinckiaceae bacterium]
MSRNADPPVIRLSEYQPPAFFVEDVDIVIALHESRTTVDVSSRMRRNAGAGAGTAALVLDGDDLRLISAEIDGMLLTGADFVATPEGLTIHSPPDSDFILRIQTEVNPSANSKLMGLYRSNGVYCTQCEADGFRRITYFLDRPDVMARYRVRIEADRDEAPVLLANGNLVESGELADGRHFAVWYDPHPKPCYLFAVVGGNLGVIHDRFVTMEGREVALGIYVERGKEALAGYAMGALKRSMTWDEEAYGRAYDLDVFNIVAVSDFNMGAMENKGLNIFNDKYVLASPETATDTDYAQIEAVIAHEYFHNWTGNRITCRDWFQLCLKEGLTVFRDQEFSADMRSRAVKRIADVRELRARQFVEDSGPLAHAVRPNTYCEINNFYTATVYEKGAEVIRMLRLIIGAEAFRSGMDLYFNRHDGHAATVEEFIACFAEASGRDLSQFFLWYEQAGTPRLTITRVYDAADRRLTLHLKQETPPTPGQVRKLPQAIPLSLGFIDPAGKAVMSGDAVVDQDLILLTTASTRVTIDDIAPDAVPSLLRGFSSPVNLDIDLTDRELCTLAEKDSDPFNRWQCLEALAMRLLKRAVLLEQPNIVRQGGAQQESDLLLLISGAFGKLLASGAADPAFAALALGLPSEMDVAREIGTDVDPDAIYKARRRLKRAVAQDVFKAALTCYQIMAPADASYAPDAASAGRRALRNVALDLMVAGDSESANPLAMSQAGMATNMTDRFAALTSLVLQGAPAREAALDAFEA